MILLSSPRYSSCTRLVFPIFLFKIFIVSAFCTGVRPPPPFAIAARRTALEAEAVEGLQEVAEAQDQEWRELTGTLAAAIRQTLEVRLSCPPRSHAATNVCKPASFKSLHTPQEGFQFGQLSTAYGSVQAALGRICGILIHSIRRDQ